MKLCSLPRCFRLLGGRLDSRGARSAYIHEKTLDPTQEYVRNVENFPTMLSFGLGDLMYVPIDRYYWLLFGVINKKNIYIFLSSTIPFSARKLRPSFARVTCEYIF